MSSVAAGGTAARRSAVWIQFKFAEPTKLSGYRWYTANDFEERDPRDWRLLGSNDGVNLVVVDKVDDFEATSELHALAGKASRDGQFYEVYHPETGEAYGGLQEKWDDKKLVIGDWMSCTHQTWSATAYLSLIYYHVLGADIREGEVVFKPYLPDGVNEIAVKDFKVGETTFDIVVVRGGNGPKETACKTTKNKRVKLFLSVAE